MWVCKNCGADQPEPPEAPNDCCGQQVITWKQKIITELHALPQERAGDNNVARPFFMF